MLASSKKLNTIRISGKLLKEKKKKKKKNPIDNSLLH